MRILMHGFYEHFPNHKPIIGKPFINCYNDCFCAKKNTEENSIALLIEPRSIDPKGYLWIEDHPNQYKYIFTHDSELLKLPNARRINFGKVWDWSDEPKTKLCSMISSDKELCELHKARKQMALDYEDKIDVFGTYNGGPMVDTRTSHAAYKFAVVIENYIDDWWFTEKICNCFANKVIPLYLGAKKIGSVFDDGGIIRFCDIEQLRNGLDNLINDPGRADRIYKDSKESIEENYQRVKKYESFETWFFNEYGNLLNEMEIKK